MTDQSFDDNTINKLIPQIFDQMKSNFDVATSNMHSVVTQNSSITTQSLIQESESLDKIIYMIEKLDKTLRTSSPSNITRMHEVCRSTNTILDAWIDIQSQAGYVHNMMDNKQYIKYLEEREKGVDFLAEETKKVDELKKELDILKKSKQAEMNAAITNSNNNNNNNINHASRGRISRTSFNRRNIRSGIPPVINRLAKPTGNSERKMFRR